MAVGKRCGYVRTIGEYSVYRVFLLSPIHAPQLCAHHLLQTQTRQVHQIKALSETCLGARPSVCVTSMTTEGARFKLEKGPALRDLRILLWFVSLLCEFVLV